VSGVSGVSGALQVRGLRVEHGERVIARQINLDVAPGEVRALMGISGVGKTTVLRALVALQPFSAGTVAMDDAFALRPGPVPSERKLRGLRRVVGLVSQAPSLFEHLTVLENVTLAPVHALGVTRAVAEDAARKLLEELGVASRADALPRQLSGGEAQRVAIARALAVDPRILLMDEPTSALDPARRGSLGQVLRQLASGGGEKRAGRGILIATHDVEFARVYADRVAVLAGGEIVEEGTAAAVLGAPAHAATRELLHHPENG
jgi:ABC-type polar amino acid transport system ATPase subunit